MVKNFSKPLGIAAFLLLFAVSMGGCADIDEGGMESTRQLTQAATGNQTQSTQEKNDSDMLKVGAILPLTGERSAYGEAMQKVAQIALDEINAGGGLKGKKLEFIWEDGKCNGDDASEAAGRLIDVEKVKIIYGGFCNSETLAIAPLAEAAKVVELSAASSSPDITNAGDYIFRNYPSDAIQGKVLAEGAAKQGFKKVGVLAEQSDYTQVIQKSFEAQFQNLGGEVIAATYFPGDSDFTNTLLKLKSDGVDSLLIDPQTPAKADLIFSQLEGMQWDVKLMGNDVVAGYQDLISKYSNLVEGMIVAEFSHDKENPDFKKLAAKFKETTGKELPYGTYASTSYDAVYIIRDALEKAGNDSDAVKAYLESIKDREGLGGALNFDENGDPTNGHSLEVVKKGRVVAY